MDRARLLGRAKHSTRSAVQKEETVGENQAYSGQYCPDLKQIPVDFNPLSGMCSCTIVSRVCPRCAISFEDIQQHCPMARASGELCANRHMAEIPGHLCTGCKERAAGIGRRAGHVARASVSSLIRGGKAGASYGQRHAVEGLTTVRYEHTRPVDAIIREMSPQERADKAKANRQTQWPSVLAAKVLTAQPQRPPALDHSSERSMRPVTEGGDRPGGSPLPPVLPHLAFPSRPLSPLGSPSGVSDSSSVYSQD